jgi:ATP-dependent DNA helicase RecQ
LLNYFDEKLEVDCDHCDNCHTDFEKIDGTIIAQKALSAIARTDQRFGQSYIIDFLRGSKSQKIKDYHKNIKTYGVGADLSKDEWFAYFKDMISQGIIGQTEDQYPTLYLTEQSNEVLRGNCRVELFKVTKKKSKSSSLVKEVSHPYIEELFTKLKGLRTKFARTENVPPYVVFSDATLVEFATYLPQNEREMLKISGVGDVKMNKYGLDFMAEIVSYCEKNSLESRIKLKAPQRKKRTKRNKKGDDTYTTSLKMFKAGNSVEEIARQRELAISTIETHLVKFIPTGEVIVEDLVASEKIEPIREAIFELNAENGISPIKEFLGDDFSYGEIRAVVAEML